MKREIQDDDAHFTHGVSQPPLRKKMAVAVGVGEVKEGGQSEKKCIKLTCKENFEG